MEISRRATNFKQQNRQYQKNVAGYRASEGGQEVPRPLDFEKFSKKVVFLVSSRKKQISPLLEPPREISVKIHLVPLLGKNPSDAHGRIRKRSKVQFRHEYLDKL